jgi:hemolysin III
MRLPPTGELKPRLRGRLHQVAFFVSLPAGAGLIAAAQTSIARVAVSIFAVALSCLYAASAALHRVSWPPKVHAWMRRLDYSAIFLLIAGTMTAFAFLALDGAFRWTMLTVGWAGAVTGIVLKMLRVDGFTIPVAILNLGMGWILLVAAPEFLPRLSLAAELLLLAGGLCYTIGFVVLARRRPDPRPAVFGYYEVWHTLVIAGSACHYALLLMLAT